MTTVTQSVEEVPEFTIALRGYDRAQVDDYVDNLTYWLRSAESRAQDAERQADALVRGVEDLERRIDEMPAPSEAVEFTPPEFEPFATRISAVLEWANQQAELIQSHAGAEASRIKDDARRQATEMVSSAEQLVTELKAAAEQCLGPAKEQADRILSSAHDRAAALAQRDEQETLRRQVDAEARATAVIEEARERRRELLEAAERRRSELAEEIETLERNRNNATGDLARLSAALHDLVSRPRPATGDPADS